MPQLVYALDKNNGLVHIDSVPNGIMCQCKCPCCGEMLIAKNNGETMESHFAHYYGTECGGAHESQLHLLAKEIISEEKSVMLPPYGSVFGGALQKFDFVEVEEADESTELRPDLCGVVRRKDGTESRLWIEIKVTHAIGVEKRQRILKNGISCIEINLNRFMEEDVSREKLRDFLINTTEGHEWTNNPILEEKQKMVAMQKRETARLLSEGFRERMNGDDTKEVNAMEKDYLSRNPSHCIVPSSKCMKCMHHTTRKAIYEEIGRRHLPSWLKETLKSDMRIFSKDNISSTVCFDRCYQIRYEGYVRLLPESSPDIYGAMVPEREIRQNKQIIPFLLNVVPDIISAHTFRCAHNKYSFPSVSARYNIACDCENIVNRHKKK